MVGNKSRDTKPELEIRKLLHSMGYRFRLQRRDLPGKPDITLPRYKTVIFIHGCFWHHHAGCPHASSPATNSAFWQKKFQDNIDRDKRNEAALKALGWRVITIWECEIKDILKTRIIPGLPSHTRTMSTQIPKASILHEYPELANDSYSEGLYAADSEV